MKKAPDPESVGFCGFVFVPVKYKSEPNKKSWDIYTRTHFSWANLSGRKEVQ